MSKLGLISERGAWKCRDFRSFFTDKGLLQPNIRIVVEMTGNINTFGEILFWLKAVLELLASCQFWPKVIMAESMLLW